MSGLELTTADLDRLGLKHQGGQIVRKPTKRERATLARAWPESCAHLPRPTSRRMEKHEQAAIVKLFALAGCEAHSTSQYRASRQALGLPDLWVFFCVPGTTRIGLGAGWFEVKSGLRWKFSAAQLQWAERCGLTGTRYACGDVGSAIVWLKSLGIPLPFDPSPLR